MRTFLLTSLLTTCIVAEHTPFFMWNAQSTNVEEDIISSSSIISSPNFLRQDVLNMVQNWKISNNNNALHIFLVDKVSLLVWL